MTSNLLLGTFGVVFLLKRSGRNNEKYIGMMLFVQKLFDFRSPESLLLKSEV